MTKSELIEQLTTTNEMLNKREASAQDAAATSGLRSSEAGFSHHFGTASRGAELRGFCVLHTRARRLAASVSLSTLGVVLAAPALAATTEGVRQEDSGTIAINLYEVAANDPDAVFGTTTTTSNPGGLATATAWVNCALSGTCPNPGALEQFATGVESATNSIIIDGLQRIEAVAQGARLLSGNLRRGALQ